MLKPSFQPDIPEETIKVAKAAFPNGNMYPNLGDTLGPIFADETFQDLYPPVHCTHC
jgi:transposase